MLICQASSYSVSYKGQTDVPWQCVRERFRMTLAVLKCLQFVMVYLVAVQCILVVDYIVKFFFFFWAHCWYCTIDVIPYVCTVLHWSWHEVHFLGMMKQAIKCIFYVNGWECVCFPSVFFQTYLVHRFSCLVRDLTCLEKMEVVIAHHRTCRHVVRTQGLKEKQKSAIAFISKTLLYYCCLQCLSLRYFILKMLQLVNLRLKNNCTELKYSCTVNIHQCFRQTEE